MASETELTPGKCANHHAARLINSRLPGGYRDFAHFNDQAPEEADRIITGAHPGI